MFRHKAESSSVSKEAQKDKTPVESVAPAPLLSGKVDIERQDLRELLEKNLKWSQIIYEQNRKINHKMIWLAVAGWLRFLIIAVPIVLALWYLPPFISRIQTSVQDITGNVITGKPNYSLEQLMQLLPLGDAEKAQLKAILK